MEVPKLTQEEAKRWLLETHEESLLFSDEDNDGHISRVFEFAPGDRRIVDIETGGVNASALYTVAESFTPADGLATLGGIPLVIVEEPGNTIIPVRCVAHIDGAGGSGDTPPPTPSIACMANDNAGDRYTWDVLAGDSGLLGGGEGRMNFFDAAGSFRSEVPSDKVFDRIALTTTDNSDPSDGEAPDQIRVYLSYYRINEIPV